jgi:hypothetical protein
MESAYQLGRQAIRLKLPQNVRVKSVELLQADKNLPFSLDDQILQFTLPSVGDYEVAAITLA